MKYRRYFRWIARTLLLLVLAWVCSVHLLVYAQDRGPTYVITIEGVVTKMTAIYMERTLRQAEASNATALIIQLHSEGSVLREVRPMAVTLANATIPIVVYITEGTQSGSAGAFFLSAAHIAAMSPNTSFGSSAPLTEVDALLSEQTKNLVLDSVSKQLRDWNEQQGRNVNWVDRAVREGVIMTNQQAFATNPPSIDIVAQDINQLMTLLEGRIVRLHNGQQIQLNTIGNVPVSLPPTLWEQILLMLSNPTITFFLIIMGGIALYAELVHPGVGIFAGMGVVFFIGALVGLLVLPIHWISLAGLVLAFLFIATDIFVPTHGALTLVGLVLMIVSSLTLIDTVQAPNVFVALWAIFLVALVIASIAAVTIWFLVRLRDKPITTGQEGMIGRLAEVRQRLSPEGMVFIEGALWRAYCENGDAEQGEWVRVVGVQDLRLIVNRIDKKGVQPYERYV